MSSINDLKGIISGKGGAARNNRFKVILPPINGVTSSEMDILCRDVNLPGRQILTRERTIGLQTRKVAYGFGQEDVSMTFLLLNDYGAKRYFEAWQNTAINQSTLEIGYKKDYSKKVSIFQLDSQNRNVYKCDLLEAFPTTMNTINLNNELDGLVEVNVQLSYTNWEPTYYENAAPTISPLRTSTSRIGLPNRFGLNLDFDVNLGPFNINIDIP
jgi:hypothetical protein